MPPVMPPAAKQDAVAGTVNLDTVIDDLWKKVPPEQRQNLQDFMRASDAFKQMAAQTGRMAQAAAEIKTAQDIPGVVAAKVRKIINQVTAHGAKKFMPISLYATQLLAVQALRLVQQMYRLPITQAILAATIQQSVRQVMAMFGLNNPQLLQQLKAQQERTGQRPAPMAKGGPAT